MSEGPQKHLYGLQYLRAVAAIAVVAFHACSRLGVSFNVGQSGVDLFFVLSGFLMWSITNAETKPSEFIKGRIRRIVPTYWIATTVVLIGANLSLFPMMRLSLFHTLTSYLFIPATSPSSDQIWPLLVPGWTLNYEMFFYLIFTLVLFLFRGAQIAALSVIFLGLTGLGLFGRPSLVLLEFYGQPIILEFLAGVLIARFWWNAHLTLVWGLAAIVLAVLWIVAATLYYPASPRILAWAPPAFLLVLGMLLTERFGAMPRIPLLNQLGDASYSIYLWHTLAISVALGVVHRLAPPLPLSVFVLILTGVSVGLVAYHMIELPIRQWMARRNKMGNAGSIADELWHRCRSPILPRRTIDGKWTSRFGQTWRRKRDGNWEYREDNERIDDFYGRQH